MIKRPNKISWAWEARIEDEGGTTTRRM